ncbi:hypothetical protein M427DRAFT_29426 [Gonapodya prolifera JEL478]|uniref:Uncharacterized protein n=1 Tax=Gonapodya prolifera (strain JEL478) TaxID=1344416 RepID=A0A139AQR5_GONPJ|nr:hypothetical protein M427DRAFT_29426 [Gonapodya prolifera JEL478]|eukprot:KXS18994.1 hypothetical protein M427DRAFT_29426 [Gonapodya prolifera JEL478]
MRVRTSLMCADGAGDWRDSRRVRRGRTDDEGEVEARENGRDGRGERRTGDGWSRTEQLERGDLHTHHNARRTRLSLRTLVPMLPLLALVLVSLLPSPALAWSDKSDNQYLPYCPTPDGVDWHDYWASQPQAAEPPVTNIRRLRRHICQPPPLPPCPNQDQWGPNAGSHVRRHECLLYCKEGQTYGCLPRSWHDPPFNYPPGPPPPPGTGNGGGNGGGTGGGTGTGNGGGNGGGSGGTGSGGAGGGTKPPTTASASAKPGATSTSTSVTASTTASSSSTTTSPSSSSSSSSSPSTLSSSPSSSSPSSAPPPSATQQSSSSPPPAPFTQTPGFAATMAGIGVLVLIGGGVWWGGERWSSRRVQDLGGRGGSPSALVR